jgi:ribonuclease HI
VHYVKLNVDGSFCGASSTGGIGMVLRDDDGSIIVSACRFLQSCQNPLEAELEACRHAISLALEWSALPCIVEMDCLEAVKMIKVYGLDRSPHTTIIHEIKLLMSSGPSIDISYNSREQNNVSHVLANHASTRSVVWTGSGPGCVPELCRNEYNLIT